jgi:DNA-binding NtrC family response regulator
MARILVVDDDDFVRRSLAISLERADHDVVGAAEGGECISLINTSSFDLVILDIIMPGQEGIETLRQLHDVAPDVPVLAISGGWHGSSIYLRMAERFGVAGTLQKPFDGPTLLRAVDACLASAPGP